VEGGAKNFGVFPVKNHDFTPKKIYIFPILGGAREIFGFFLPLNALRYCEYVGFQFFQY
jgi:hypothetical protein